MSDLLPFGNRQLLIILVLVGIVVFEFALAIAFHAILVHESSGPVPGFARYIRQKAAHASRLWVARLLLGAVLGILVLLVLALPTLRPNGTDADNMAINQRVAGYLVDLLQSSDYGPLRRHVFYSVEDGELDRVRKLVQEEKLMLVSIDSVDVHYDQASVKIRLRAPDGETHEEILKCQRDADGWRIRDLGFDEKPATQNAFPLKAN
jgi:hypothetical protein